MRKDACVDMLTTLGVVSTGAAIVFYYLEPRHRLWVLAFAGASLSSAVYAFLQGAWPFGVAEIFWVTVALQRYALLVRGGESAYVPGAKPMLSAAARAYAPGGSATHCRAGYRLRRLEVHPQQAPPPSRRAVVDSRPVAQAF